MRIMNELQWIGEYTMEDFVTEFSKRTPVLMKTLTGTLGCDELHIISGDEVYWIRSLKKQKRIVAATKDKDKFLSIPVTYNRLSFELYTDGNASKKIQPGKPLIAIMEEVEFQSGKKYFIRAEQNKKILFQVGSDAGNNARFGVMEIIDTYEEKYLLGHPICNNQIHSNTFAIPVYMNIELTVATSFLTHCQESFDTWFKHIEAIVSKFPEGEVKMCEEIILFDKCPNNSTYEYIDPRTFTLNEKSKNSLQDYTRESNPYVIDRPTLPDRTSLWKPTTIQSVTLPHIPRRTPPAPPQEGAAAQTEEPSTNLGNSLKKIQKGSVKNPKAPPTPPKPPSDYERPCPHPHDNQPYVSVTQRNLNADLKRNFEELKRCRNSNILKPDSGDIVRKETVATESAPQSGDMLSISSIYEVSPTADVRRFSIKDVQRSLKLLNMEKHCELFEEMQVDGELLLEMMEHEEILIEEFHLSKFEALKLIRFAKKGWKPNP